MPGYGKRMEMYAPTKTDGETIKSRFALPNLTIIQIVLLVAILAFAFNARKTNRPIIMSLGFAMGILHIYDHLYRVKRGPEQFLFSGRKEGYKCGACK